MQIVYVRRIGMLVAAVLTAAMIFGCSSEKSSFSQEGPINSDTYLATIDGSPAVTLGALFEQMQRMTAPGGNKPSTPENAFDELLYRKLAEIKAGTFKDFDKKEIDRLAKNRFHDVLMQFLYEKTIANRVVVSEASIDSLYQANIALYSVPERRAVTHILFSENPKAWEAVGVDVTGLSVEQLRAKAKSECQRCYQEVMAGADIAELASKWSHDSNSKARNGASGWFARPEMVEEFSNAAFSLGVGKVSKPFSSIYGWHLLRVDSASTEVIQPLDSVLREQLRAELRSGEESAYGQVMVDSIFRLAEFEWNEELLAKTTGDYDPFDWVCIVNKTDTIDAIVLRENELMYRTRNRTSEVSPEIRKDIVRVKATPWVLISSARQMGLMDTDTMRNAFENFRRAEVVNRIFRDRVPTDLTWTDEQLESYYNSHIGDFKSDKPVQLQHIVFEDSLRAIEALKEIRAGADFRATAMKYYPGDDDFKEAAFDLGWISRDDVSPELYDRAWLTPVGEVSGPQRSQWGFHLIKVLDRKSQLDFQGAKTDVRRKMREEAYKQTEEKWIAGLKEGRDIVRLDEVWDQIDFTNPMRYRAVADSIKQAQASSATSGK